jgi:glucan phosphorylase
MHPIDQIVDAAADAGDLYTTLEETVIPLFYRRHDGFIDIMRHAIALNGSFFTAQRMLQEYIIKAYNKHAVDEVALSPERHEPLAAAATSPGRTGA